MLRPAPPGAGIVFESEGTRIPALVDHVADTRLGTSLGAGGVTVGTVEHLLAALYGVGCHDVSVQVAGPEVPAMDGSAALFVRAIDEAGVVEHGPAFSPLGPDPAIRVVDGESETWAFPWERFAVTVIVEYPGTVANRQALSLEVSGESFRRGIAPARTFALEGEYQAIKEAGLAKGGGPENAFLVGESGYSGELRFPDEVVRHKALDLIGDLVLAGGPVCAHILAIRPGHRVNVMLAAALRDAAAAPGTEER